MASEFILTTQRCSFVLNAAAQILESRALSPKDPGFKFTGSASNKDALFAAITYFANVLKGARKEGRVASFWPDFAAIAISGDDQPIPEAEEVAKADPNAIITKARDIALHLSYAKTRTFSNVENFVDEFVVSQVPFVKIGAISASDSGFIIEPRSAKPTQASKLILMLETEGGLEIVNQRFLEALQKDITGLSDVSTVLGVGSESTFIKNRIQVQSSDVTTLREEKVRPLEWLLGALNALENTLSLRIFYEVLAKQNFIVSGARATMADMVRNVGQVVLFGKIESIGRARKGVTSLDHTVALPDLNTALTTLYNEVHGSVSVKHQKNADDFAADTALRLARKIVIFAQGSSRNPTEKKEAYDRLDVIESFLISKINSSIGVLSALSMIKASVAAPPAPGPSPAPSPGPAPGPAPAPTPLKPVFGRSDAKALADYAISSGALKRAQDRSGSPNPWVTQTTNTKFKAMPDEIKTCLESVLFSVTGTIPPQDFPHRAALSLGIICRLYASRFAGLANLNDSDERKRFLEASYTILYSLFLSALDDAKTLEAVWKPIFQASTIDDSGKPAYSDGGAAKLSFIEFLAAPVRESGNGHFFVEKTYDQTPLDYSSQNPALIGTQNYPYLEDNVTAFAVASLFALALEQSKFKLSVGLHGSNADTTQMHLAFHANAAYAPHAVIDETDEESEIKLNEPLTQSERDDTPSDSDSFINWGTDDIAPKRNEEFDLSNIIGNGNIDPTVKF